MPRRRRSHGGRGGDTRQYGYDRPVHQVPRKTCSECFGPRSAYTKTFWCAQCERRLFPNGYLAWVHWMKTLGGLRLASHEEAR